MLATNASVTTTRMRGLSVRLTLAVVLVSGLGAPPGGTGAAQAAEVVASERARVSGKRLPTVRQVSRTFSYLRGGSRTLLPDYRQSVDEPGSNCVTYANSTVPVTSSRVASYEMADGQSPYFSGFANPTVAVYKFRSHRAAAVASRKLRAAIRACLGKTEDPDMAGYAVTYRRLPLAKARGSRLAYLRIRDDANTGRDWWAETWVIRGKYLLSARLQHNLRAPRVKALHALTRLAVRSLH